MWLYVAPTHNPILFKITAFKYMIKEMVIFFCFITSRILLMN